MSFLNFVRNYFQNYQFGDGVTTRAQARQNPELQPEQSTSGPPAKRQKEKLREPEPEPEPQEDDEMPEEAAEPTQNGEHDLFNHETLVASNDLLDAYVIKEFHKKQKIFK